MEKLSADERYQANEEVVIDDYAPPCNKVKILLPTLYDACTRRNWKKANLIRMEIQAELDKLHVLILKREATECQN